MGTDFESGRWMYMAGASMALSATPILMFVAGGPWLGRTLLTIDGLMLAMVSNPGSMKKAADQWMTANGGPGTSNSDYIDKLGDEMRGFHESLRNLTKQTKQDEVWTGSPFEAFDDAVTKFLDALEIVRTARNNCGKTLEGCAKIYMAGAQISFLVGSFMVALAGSAMVTIAGGPAALGLARAIYAIQLRNILPVLKTVVSGHKKALIAVTVIMALVRQHCDKQGQLFFGMSSLKMEQPPSFKGAEVKSRQGLPVHEPDMEVPKQPKPSILDSILPF
ncbi:hypothetical protein D5H75_24105 [Bailinhaonella thermotolerans]|uniref:Uncharacterized protein n=1 Tax=Bailinhaonella thermotolerans TaxID=1070861 RepID=A0A3A4ANI7_9ACTN|nr:hypothetical protein D5H75_24105 [Bailinhaonella thermotolerans]